MTKSAAPHSERLIFSQAFQALFGVGLQDKLTPAFRGELMQLGVDIEHFKPGYPYEVWEAAIKRAVTLLPTLSEEDALQELGRRMVNGTIDLNPLGKTLMPLLKVMGVCSALKRSLRRNAAENFNEVTFGAESKTSLQVNMSFVGSIPNFARGTLVGLAQILGASNPRCDVLTYEPTTHAATYNVTWQ